MKTHDLKTDPAMFEDLVAGRKTFEIRRNDRGFQVGDRLNLHKTVHTGVQMQNGEPLVFTGETITRTITHVLTGGNYGVILGWVVLSLSQGHE